MDDRNPVAQLTYATFGHRDGEAFVVTSPAVRLVQAAAVDKGEGYRSGGQFSVLFHGPAEPALEQRIYELTHDEIGTFELFLVPVGRVGDGYEYEAAFC